MKSAVVGSDRSFNCQADSMRERCVMILSFLFRCHSNKQVNNPTTHEGGIGERPEVAYHILHTVSLGLLSMMMEG